MLVTVQLEKMMTNSQLNIVCIENVDLSGNICYFLFPKW